MAFDAVAYLESLFTTPAATAGRGVGTELLMPTPLADSGIGPDDLPGDWRCVFEERAAIMEYHGELPRELAEAKALTETVRLMEAEEMKKAEEFMECGSDWR